MNDTWLDDLIGTQIPEGWVWNSGDYKGATDNLNSNACRVAELRILENLGLTGLITHLTDAEIWYKIKDFKEDPRTKIPQIPLRLGSHCVKGKTGWFFKMKQENGQLMGHPLSFPVLCLINLAGLQIALKRGRERGLVTKETCEFILRNTKINGDDILFPCPASFCQVWEDATAELGLKLSVGKSYASEYFAVINSRQFVVTKRGLQRFEYVNFSLVENYNLKKEKDGKKLTPWEVGHSFNEMFQFSKGLGVAFLPDAIQNRSEGLPLTGFVPNFFVPCHYGGYGVEPKWSDKDKIKVSIEQRQVASLFHQDVLSSFAFADGLGELDRESRRFSKRLPKCYPLSKGMSVWGAEESGTFETRIQSVEVRGGEVSLTWASARKSYGTWLGVLNSTRFVRGKFTPKAPVMRKLARERLKGVAPMKVEKIFAGNYILTCPQNLPKPVTAHFSYENFGIHDWSQYAPVRIRTHSSGDGRLAIAGSRKLREMLDNTVDHTPGLEQV